MLIRRCLLRRVRRARCVRCSRRARRSPGHRRRLARLLALGSARVVPVGLFIRGCLLRRARVPQGIVDAWRVSSPWAPLGSSRWDSSFVVVLRRARVPQGIVDAWRVSSPWAPLGPSRWDSSFVVVLRRYGRARRARRSPGHRRRMTRLLATRHRFGIVHQSHRDDPSEAQGESPRRAAALPWENDAPTIHPHRAESHRDGPSGAQGEETP